MRWATEAGSARSNPTAVAVPPAATIRSAVCRAPAVTMSPPITRHPSSPSLIAVAAPIPLAPPATTATLPSSPRMLMRHPFDGLFLPRDFTSTVLEDEVTAMRDAMQAVHDRTIEAMTSGTDLYTAMREITVPQHLDIG